MESLVGGIGIRSSSIRMSFGLFDLFNIVFTYFVRGICMNSGIYFWLKDAIFYYAFRVLKTLLLLKVRALNNCTSRHRLLSRSTAALSPLTLTLCCRCGSAATASSRRCR